MEKNRTTPVDLAPKSQRQADFEQACVVELGVATKYWLELKQYLPGSARSLWLYVNDVWRHLDDPDLGTQISVQDAFCQCPDRLETAVWYKNDVIVGLVVRSK